MKRRTKVFSLIMAFALLITGIVPGIVQSKADSEAAAVTIITTNNVTGSNQSLVIITGYNVCFRNGPSTSSTSELQLGRGSTLLYMSTNGEWYRCRHLDLNLGVYVEGYVHSNYAQRLTANYGSSSIVPFTGNNITIRNRPFLSGTAVGSIQSGASLLVKINTVNPSHQIYYEDGYYWMPVSYAGSGSTVGYVAIAEYHPTSTQTGWQNPLAIQLCSWVHASTFYSRYTIAGICCRF